MPKRGDLLIAPHDSFVRVRHVPPTGPPGLHGRLRGLLDPYDNQLDPGPVGLESMSIYATLWQLKFPRYGDDHTNCEWVDVIAQGVPAHIGSPTPGCGYETGDPYAEFLPPAIEVGPDNDGTALRAVVFVTGGTAKGTPRATQEYVDPLLVLSGKAYEVLSFGEVHQRICDALRGNRPRVVVEEWSADGSVRLVFEDGTREEVPTSGGSSWRGGRLAG